MDKVLVGLSGGVDSAVAAALLQRGGFEVTGLFMRVPGAADGEQAARAVAGALGIALVARDAECFGREIINYFISEYRAGRTPNPCVRCNPGVKFRALCDCADECGAAHIATGHYARVRRDEASGRTLLCRAAHTEKDQSYMLHRLTQPQLSRLLTPLGGMSKRDVRALAGKLGLPCASTPDSQDICFIPGGDHAGFIARTGPLTPGSFVDLDGHAIAPHAGMERYTVGQRRGLGIAAAERLYVHGIDSRTGAVTLGPRADLMQSIVHTRDMVYIPWDVPPARFGARVRLRFSGGDTAALVEADGGGAVIRLDSPAVATPGQYAVLYDGDVVLGGGVIRLL